MAAPNHPPRRPSGGADPSINIGHPAFNALAEPHQAGTYWTNVFGPPATQPQVAEQRVPDYNRLNAAQSNASLRSMEYGDVNDEHVPPSFKDKCVSMVRWALYEWRIISVIILLVVICVLIGDVDINVHWKNMQDYEPPITYSFLQKAMRKHPSFMTYYTLPSDSSVLMMDIPLSFLSKTAGSSPVIISASFARGLWDDQSSVYLLHGPAEDTDHNVFIFNLTADRSAVDIIRQQYGVRTSLPEDDLAVKLGALSSRVGSLPIVAINDGKDPSVVVDGTDLINNGFFVADASGATEARIDFSGSSSYPKNFDVSIEYMMPKSKEDPTEVPVSILFSIALLPDKPLLPRALDDRVGFFYLQYTDIGDHRADTNISAFMRHESETVDPRIRAINRRRLKSGADMKPITYYIDPTVPLKWRSAFKAGVEAWQPAFKAAGFGEKAIRAITPNETDWPSDYAAGDIRYSSISWVVDMDNTFALGPSVVDPRSGEILDSDIIFTHGWLQHYIGTIEAQDVSRSPPATSPSLDDVDGVLSDLYMPPSHSHSHHHHHDDEDDHDHHSHGVGKKSVAGKTRRAMYRSSLRHHRRGACQEAKAKFDLSPHLARIALAAGDPAYMVGDDILFAGVREVIMHEVGHTLGLRHNFKASSAVTWEQTQDITYTKTHGLTLSVMDYLPMNLVSGREAGTQVDYFTPVVGAYDIMAIQYGYTEVNDEKPGMPHPDLIALADLNLPFATDEDDATPNGPDPTVSTFDFTADPARFFLDRLDLVTELRPNLLDRTVYVGDQYTRLASADLALQKASFNAAQYLCKYIGGYQVNRHHRTGATEQEQAPIQAMSGADQTRALTGVLRVLSDDTGIFMEPEMAGYNLKRSGECEGFWQYCLGRAPVDILNNIDVGRISVLSTLLDEDRLSRLRTADWVLAGQGKDSVSVPTLFETTTTALWGADLALSTRLDNLRTWSMALAYIDRLLVLTTSKKLPPEIMAVASGELFKIQDSISAALSAGTVTGKSATYPLLRTVQVKLEGNHFYVDSTTKAAATVATRRRSVAPRG